MAVALHLGTKQMEKDKEAIMMDGGEDLEGTKTPVKVKLKHTGINTKTNLETVGTQTPGKGVRESLENMEKSYIKNW